MSGSDTPWEDGSFETRLRRRGVDLATIHARTDGTLVVAGELARELAETRMAESALTLGPEGATIFSTTAGDAPVEVPLATESLVHESVLGRGGMGEVSRVRQMSLGRSVAVKTVLDPTDSRALRALCSEAWVGGFLAHPNMVPVHLLARAGSSPALVMKCIEGQSWAELLRRGRLVACNSSGEHEPAAPVSAGTFRSDVMTEHLRIFGEVCQALRFAHERGVLHLDVKPENVMVGDFGEVLLLDWGLARATARGPSWLPKAHLLQHPCGTPAYMAPELAEGDGGSIDERTDVYLLGATLHFIVTGTPLHDGDSLVEVLRSAFASEAPTFPPQVPSELAAIVTRATARRSSDRFGSVGELLHAVESYERHRPVHQLVDGARAALGRLTGVVDAIERGGEAESLLAECELGLELARARWPEHPGLAELRDEVSAFRARRALVLRRPDEALAALRAASRAWPDLEARAESLRVELEAAAKRQRELERLGYEFDLTLGTPARRGLFAVLGTAWMLSSSILGWFDRSRTWPIGYTELILLNLSIGVCLAPFLWRHRATYFLNLANRRLYGSLIATAIGIQAHFALGASLGLEVRTTIALTPLFYAYSFASVALAADRRFLWGAAVLVAVAACSLVLPEWAFEWVGVGGFAASIATVVASRPARNEQG